MTALTTSVSPAEEKEASPSARSSVSHSHVGVEQPTTTESTIPVLDSRAKRHRTASTSSSSKSARKNGTVVPSTARPEGNRFLSLFFSIFALLLLSCTLSDVPVLEESRGEVVLHSRRPKSSVEAKSSSPSKSPVYAGAQVDNDPEESVKQLRSREADRAGPISAFAKEL
ncbi:unnamed protein product [Amoebophrya sp. A120]|nr:unnamed protein product [Amoebophrya sp. A120]|eukprot:GSA120T00008111001.1